MLSACSTTFVYLYKYLRTARHWTAWTVRSAGCGRGGSSLWSIFPNPQTATYRVRNECPAFVFENQETSMVYKAFTASDRSFVKLFTSNTKEFHFFYLKSQLFTGGFDITGIAWGFYRMSGYFNYYLSHKDLKRSYLVMCGDMYGWEACARRGGCGATELPPPAAPDRRVGVGAWGHGRGAA